MTDRPKARVAEALAALTRGGPLEAAYHADAVLHASWPWGALSGAGLADFWAGLTAAFPDAERRDLIRIAGTNRDDPRFAGPRAPHLVACLGIVQGTFRAPLLGLPPTGGVVHLRLAEAHWLDGDRIRESHLILDLVDFLDQIGLSPLPRSFGAPGLWPGPATGDGLRPDGAAPAGADALDTVLAMHGALQSFDGRNLDSMPHADHWTEDFMYYAAGGIGMARGLEGFRAHHQIPFLRAFPDRRSEGHFIRLADGPYAVTGGVVTGTHSGPWLGMTATGRTARLPVFDFYRLEGDRIAENWLPADVAGCAAGLGNDLLARARHYAGAPDRAL
ncbi:MAG: ester cyclase [Paracoccaceae bacterium]|nr:ester cyclase [Paracoccaceae bacterium]